MSCGVSELEMPCNDRVLGVCFESRWSRLKVSKSGTRAGPAAGVFLGLGLQFPLQMDIFHDICICNL